MDDVDQRLIAELRRDGRAALSELAERFADASFRDALRGAADAGALHAALRDSGMAA